MNLYYFILSVLYFCSERPPLSKVFYSMCGLFLSRKTATLQRSVARDFGVVSQTKLFLGKNFTKQCFGLPQESPCFYCNDT